jgi:branched-chain amino acid transport system permease protein
MSQSTDSIAAAVPASSRLLAVLSRVAFAIVAAIAILALPFLLSAYNTFLATSIMINAVALLGLNLLTGYNGQISLGHGAFYAIGAYTAALLMHYLAAPYWLTIPAAGLLCLFIGFLFGLPALRLEGHYLALATFCLAIVVPQLLRSQYLSDWTGGVQGILLRKPKAPFGLPLTSDQWLYFFVLLVTVILFLMGRNLLRGKIGRALVAVRDQPIAAAAMGIDIAMVKTTTFGISAAYAAMAGALSGIVFQYVAPDSFDVFVSVGFLVGIVIGGLASLPGCVIGAAFILLVPNVAQGISKAAPWAIYGILLIVFIALLPGGMAGAVKNVVVRLQRFVRGYDNA